MVDLKLQTGDIIVFQKTVKGIVPPPVRQNSDEDEEEVDEMLAFTPRTVPEYYMHLRDNISVRVREVCRRTIKSHGETDRESMN
jgi:hypothetical protein